MVIKLSKEQVKSLYQTSLMKDFPDNERKPLSVMLKSMDQGVYECLGIVEEDEIRGYAFFVKNGNDYLFDYLAVIGENRNRGVGAEFLKYIAEYFKDADSVIGEVEDPLFAKNEEDRKLQKRRLAFYLRNGYEDTGVRAVAFGANFIILKLKNQINHTIPEIERLYKIHYKSFLPKLTYWRHVKIKEPVSVGTQKKPENSVPNGTPNGTRIFLREMTEDDFEAMNRVIGDDENMKHYPHSFDEEKVRAWIERNQKRYQDFGFGLWAVCLKETGELIGDCGLTMQVINGEIKPEIGYHIRRDLHRQGYGKEAAIAVRDWTFEHTPFRVIYTYMKYTNEASSATAVSWGCRQVDEFEDEKNKITKVYAITREEWEKLKEEK